MTVWIPKFGAVGQIPLGHFGALITGGLWLWILDDDGKQSMVLHIAGAEILRVICGVCGAYVHNQSRAIRQAAKMPATTVPYVGHMLGTFICAGISFPFSSCNLAL